MAHFRLTADYLHDDQTGCRPSSTLAFTIIKTCKEMKNLANADDHSDSQTVTIGVKWFHASCMCRRVRRLEFSRDCTGCPILQTDSKSTDQVGRENSLRFRIPSIRLIDSTQSGIRSTEDAEQLIGWLRTSYPRLVIVFSDVMTDTPLYTAVSKARL